MGVGRGAVTETVEIDADRCGVAGVVVRTGGGGGTGGPVGAVVLGVNEGSSTCSRRSTLRIRTRLVRPSTLYSISSSSDFPSSSAPNGDATDRRPLTMSSRSRVSFSVICFWSSRYWMTTRCPSESRPGAVMDFPGFRHPGASPPRRRHGTCILSPRAPHCWARRPRD